MPRKGGHTERPNRKKNVGHRMHRRSKVARQHRALSKKWWVRG